MKPALQTALAVESILYETVVNSLVDANTTALARGLSCEELLLHNTVTLVKELQGDPDRIASLLAQGREIGRASCRERV